MPDTTWYQQNSKGEPVINVYFFWSKKCPHCLEALPFMQQLDESRKDIKLHSLQLVGEPENIQRYQYMAMKLGHAAQSVPAILFCKSMWTGFDAEQSPVIINRNLDQCRKQLDEFHDLKDFSYQPDQHVNIQLPLIGTVNTADIESLPLITFIIAILDAFNPCAFFVLMFLLSMMLHTHNRKRMFTVGGLFVLISGVMYFLFMTAWLNLFRVIGQVEIITIIAGVVAASFGLINIKDYFWFKQGVSLSMSDDARHSIIKRMRGLLRSDSMVMLLFATVGLALFANLYEFLCTAGFPMVYTRILTLVGMPDWQYYAYLGLYNVVYVLPLLAIVILFSVTMGAHKLQQTEGKTLKLISGVMMLVLGVILIVFPDLLRNIFTTATVMFSAVLVSLLVQKFYLKAKK